VFTDDIRAKRFREWDSVLVNALTGQMQIRQRSISDNATYPGLARSLGRYLMVKQFIGGNVPRKLGALSPVG
jgi:hypothetical protein